MTAPDKAVTNIVVMGVAGCGKSTLGQALATALDRPFHDGDDFHPQANVDKMSAGLALNDDDRVAWLAALRDLLGKAEAQRDPIVVACSALKDKYRRQLSGDSDILFVFLDIPEDIATARLAERTDHFMPASLVRSQFDTLEVPGDALRIDNSADLAIVENGLIRDVRLRLGMSRQTKR